LATQPKTFSANTVDASGRRRIAELAEQTALSDAQRWFTRERAWINEQHLALCRIPAPTFFEQQRAEWFRSQLETLGWSARIDRAGNVLAKFGARSSFETREAPLIISAHLDTVLAPRRPGEIYYGPDGRLFGPGVSDNGTGLAALFAIARMLKESPELYELAASLLLIANVGEEGEGNLSGMRYLCRQSSFPNSTTFIVLDGPSIEHITVQALASRRFEITLIGPGGHSWNDYGTPNPVHALTQAVSEFLQSADSRMNGDLKGRCSYNFGVIEGGSSVNSIPAEARAKLDLRSEEANMFDEFSSLLNSAVEHALERENKGPRTARLSAKIRSLGARPGGTLPGGSHVLKTVQAVDEHLKIHSRIDCASTDANIPLSLGLPAISIGTGGQGGGAHTTEEWYQPEGRDLGLQRILLILAALAADKRGDPRSTLSAEL